MSSIKIAELRPAGSELFQDSESFLNELSDGQEMDMVLGGGRRSGFSFSFGSFRTINSTINTASLVSKSVVTTKSVVTVNTIAKGGKGKKGKKRH
ncbi:hypothetical protein BJP36_33565 [Moorena producens JHB]|uniref:Uncharacterized protein n=1 Tax=Moorena producens (strain JHB) TaxID=1454205 RepID=A0A1D9G983_MOOP1|nr:hypothetical protein [Moorena producens]AOY84121.1 hypothetical protein BJP36_33565 [Moorena producens JHB]